MENHDAVIEATLRDIRGKLAQAQVRLRQMERERVRLRQQRESELADVLRWRQRAQQTAGADETRALECIRRARQCDERAARLAESESRCECAVDKLRNDVAAGGQRLQAMQQIGC